jgi:hypothetical protein
MQVLLNKMAGDGYSYSVVYHVRDLIERDKHVLPIEMYAQLLDVRATGPSS